MSVHTSFPASPRCCFCDNKYHSKCSDFLIPSKEFLLEFFRLKNSCNHFKDVFKKTSKTNVAENKTACFNCFSSEHETSFCKEEPYFFLPKIDQALFQRFKQIINGFEQNSKRLIVVENMKVYHDLYYIPNIHNANILVTQTLKIGQFRNNSKIEEYIYAKLFSLFVSKALINNARIIELENIKVTGEEFFQLLSPKTRELKLFNVEITSNVKFSDVLLKLPKIEKMVIKTVYIEFDDLWTKILTDNCKVLKEFIVPFKSLNLIPRIFDGVSKKWPKNGVRYFLNHEELNDEKSKKLSNFCIETDNEFLYAIKIVTDVFVD